MSAPAQPGRVLATMLAAHDETVAAVGPGEASHVLLGQVVLALHDWYGDRNPATEGPRAAAVRALATDLLTGGAVELDRSDVERLAAAYLTELTA